MAPVSSLEFLRWERRRKLQVREAFARGLEQFRNDPARLFDFVLACAEYLALGQRRLVDQDRRLVEVLSPKVPAGNREDHAAMEALRGRLDLAGSALADFEHALVALRSTGVAGAREFDAAATRFLDFSVNVLGARSHSLRHLTTTLLGEADWQHIVARTEEFVSTEAARFTEIGRRAPAGLAPENMSTEGGAHARSSKNDG